MIFTHNISQPTQGKNHYELNSGKTQQHKVPGRAGGCGRGHHCGHGLECEIGKHAGCVHAHEEADIATQKS